MQIKNTKHVLQEIKLLYTDTTKKQLNYKHDSKRIVNAIVSQETSKNIIKDIRESTVQVDTCCFLPPIQ